MSRRRPLIRAIPTKYAGVAFRSRLEAMWAKQFDVLGWDWTYEPDLQVGFVIPDFLIGAARPLLLECKPASTLDEVAEQRGILIKKMCDWFEVDLVREIQLLNASGEDSLSALEDLERVARGLNPRGCSARAIVVGPRLFREPERVTVDGEHGFCLCSHPVAGTHAGLTAALGDRCLVCGNEATAWMPPDLVIGSWRETCSSLQWQPKKRRRRKR